MSDAAAPDRPPAFPPTPDRPPAFDAVYAAASRRLAALRSASDVREVRATASSPCGTVTATVDAGGALVALDIAESLRGQRGRDVARLVVETSAAAASDAATAWERRLTTLHSSLSEG